MHYVSTIGHFMEYKIPEINYLTVVLPAIKLYTYVIPGAK